MTAPNRPALPSADGTEDPHLWLEDVTGEDALAWVTDRSRATEAGLDQNPLTAQLHGEIRDILDAADRIPAVVKRGEHLYNFWTDADHERGLWRRTTLEQFRSDDPEWEVLLDLDALSAEEDRTWVFHGAQLLRPADGEPWRRALISLSDGGSDADETREFDLVTRAFVPESEKPFHRPAAKGSMSWIDEDTVWVSTDFGEDTMTTSGYPRQVRLLQRGQALEDAALVHEADPTDMVVAAVHDSTPGYERDWAVTMHAFYSNTTYAVDRTEAPPRLSAIDKPDDATFSAWRDIAVFDLRSDWEVGDEVHPSGSLLVAPADDVLRGDFTPTALFTPTATSSLQGLTMTRSCLILTILEDVQHRLEVLHRDEDGAWVREDLFNELSGTISVAAVDSDVSDDIWVTVEDFITPTTLMLADLAGVPTGEGPGDLEVIKSTPARFEADGLQVTQHFATSEDGTRIPYFEVSAADDADPEDGEAPVGPAPTPTLLYGYGGFEISMTPGYAAAVGRAWLQRGGTYVVANIRGGGEYGPAWHRAALQEKRHRAYEDFAAVARDLIDRGVTTSDQLAVRGGSNGGLLTGNMLTQYPELFGAVVIQVPLLDMKRYSHLLAGASWMAEYGDPDTDDWEFIRTFSPYHLLSEDVDYPETFVLTSTRDDRVHPGHARKFTAALESLGAPVRYWENVEGGHGGASTSDQTARMNALMYTFLWETIGTSRKS
ncbi:prolyl oligopeptidase family serine peptidase [Helcobacillus massiliensis]|uniref:prolyl oligopeptidase family serine peptidase n=1 Tax=Helcobacillus massiliensis TaxID=521392 RepID=UPI002552D528|nr:prolyl oligopeptidase family serine peptidase [Helcobacillus massiliensis]MDK7741435.1 prolyl oligopeptidase family serine peptidase [Helcobacillus massiliensis]WOO92443.1 prolyl oligopeptidase family serine peptidase [Helcobacillus massiliensis]